MSVGAGADVSVGRGAEVFVGAGADVSVGRGVEVCVGGGGEVSVGDGTGVRVLVGLGVLVGSGVFVIVGVTGVLVGVGGKGELVLVGRIVGVLDANGFEFAPCLGRFVLVIGTTVDVAVFVGGSDVTEGDAVTVPGNVVLEADGLMVGVIRCCGNDSIVNAAAVLTLAMAI